MDRIDQLGLVTVPVRMISATKSQDVRFHQLEEGTSSASASGVVGADG
jgi:non-homologous end joining protein Ku